MVSARPASRPAGPPSRVVLLDPSLFTLPFDLHLARALAELGAEVGLVGRPLREGERLVAEGFRFLPLFYRWSEPGPPRGGPLRRLAKALEHPLGYSRLRSWLERGPPAVLHLQWALLPGLDRLAFARLARRHLPILTVHDAGLQLHDARSLLGPFGARLQTLGRDALLRRMAGFVCHSERARSDLLARGIAAERILLLPHPPLKPLAAPTAAPAADDRFTFLLFGTLKPYKGVDVLVEAGLRLARSRRDFLIRIAGQPFFDLAPLRRRIAAAGAESCFAFELGYLPEERLAALLQQAGAVLFPYRKSEGSGALALAASYGKPLLASRVGVFAEPPIADHVALAPPEDAEALTALLARLLDDPAWRARLAAACRRLHRALGDWRDYARACLAFYLECMQSTRKLCCGSTR